MKDYIKTTSGLESINSPTIKIYSTVSDMNSDISNIADGEVVIVRNVAMYQKTSGSMVDVSSPAGGPVASAGHIGDVVAYYGNTNPDPTKFVVCDGNTFSSTDFPELYSILGTNTTPNLTKVGLKGTPVGGNVHSLKTTTGAWYHTSHPVSISDHTHTIASSTHCHCVYKDQAKGYKFGVLSFWRFNCSYVSFVNCGTCRCAQAYAAQSICLDPAALETLNSGCTMDVITNQNTTATNGARSGTETKGKTKTVLYLIRGKL